MAVAKVHFLKNGAKKNVLREISWKLAMQLHGKFSGNFEQQTTVEGLKSYLTLKNSAYTAVDRKDCTPALLWSKTTKITGGVGRI